jgi:glycerol-3-phosphate dehydrogenase (NAD(P)+)
MRRAGMSIVTILGAGLMGSALAWPLSDNGHTVRLVGTFLDEATIASCKEARFHPRLARSLPGNVTAFSLSELALALEGAAIVVSGVNSLGVHWIGQVLGPLLKKDQILIAVTKGLEAGADGLPRILPDVLRAELPPDLAAVLPIAAIGGPCIAGELAGRRQSFVMFGCRDPAALEFLVAAFSTAYYHVTPTADILGLEYCAALKNAYTLGVGLAAGMLEREKGPDEAGAWMHNLAAALFAEGTTEMARFLEISGARKELAYMLPGAGDLYVTAMGGRTVRLGRLLGSGRSYAEARELLAGETLEAAEIVKTMGRVIPALEAKGLLSKGELPLLRSLVAVIGGSPVDIPFASLFGKGDTGP